MVYIIIEINGKEVSERKSQEKKSRKKFIGSGMAQACGMSLLVWELLKKFIQFMGDIKSFNTVTSHGKHPRKKVDINLDVFNKCTICWIIHEYHTVEGKDQH